MLSSFFCRVVGSGGLALPVIRIGRSLYWRGAYHSTIAAVLTFFTYCVCNLNAQAEAKVQEVRAAANRPSEPETKASDRW